MKSSSLLSIVSALAVCAGAAGPLKAQSLPPYVETTSLTLEWNFIHDYISTTTQAPGPTPPPDFDPLEYNPVEPISTDTSTGRSYVPGIGTQDFFIQRMLQALTRNKGYDLDGNSYILGPEVLRPALISKPFLPAPWQIVAVREVPRNIEEMATNPYTIYLSFVSRVAPGNFAPVDPVPFDEMSEEETPDLDPIPVRTGMTLTLGQWAATGKLSETYLSTDNGDIVVDALGRVTTAFQLSFGAVFYDDPQHAAANNAEPHQYHLKRHIWQLLGNGHLTYNVRRIPAPYGTVPQAPVGVSLNGSFVATAVTMTGTGYFSHQFLEWTAEKTPEDTYVVKEFDTDTRISRAGLAPLRIKMGTIQYQNRNMFPGFGE